VVGAVATRSRTVHAKIKEMSIGSVEGRNKDASTF
jgi:hypothetical protein